MIDFVLRFRVSILIILIGLTLPLAYQIRYLTRDAGISALVPKSHPSFQFSSRVEEEFGATDQIVVGVNSEHSIFTKDALSLIQELTQFFEGLEEIDEEDVISLTTVKEMDNRDGELVIDPLIDEETLADLTEENIAKIRERVRTNPLFRGKLVSLDEKSAVVLAGVPTKIGLEEESIAALKEKSLNKLKALKKRYPHINLDFSGPAMLKAYISEYMQSDLKKLFPLAIITVSVLIVVLLRSFLGMLMPVLVTLFAVIWTFGLKSLLLSPITIVETAIPVVLIAIGCADGIHIVSEFLTLRNKGVKVFSAVKRTFEMLKLPVILTSVTTSLGFLSLVTAPGVSIRNMGIFLAFGVMVAMVFSLFFIPSLLSFFRGVKKSGRQNDQSILSAVAQRPVTGFEKRVEIIIRWLLKRKQLVVMLGFVLLALSVFGILNIQVESDEVRYLRVGNEFRTATENIQRNLGGITSLDIVIEGQEKDMMKQPGLLKAIEGLQQFCEEDNLVSYSLSLVDLIKRINLVLHDNNSSYDRLPKQTEEIEETGEKVSGFLQIAQYLFLYELSGGDTIDQYVDPDYKMTRVTVRLKDMSSQRLKRLVDKLDGYVKTHFPQNVTVKYANHYIRVVMMDLIIESQINSLITILVTITILMALMFRSALIGFFTALPVFIAVLFNFTIMWAFDVTLNIGTSIIASVGMGVGIDYAIHYFSRFKWYYKNSGQYEGSIVQAVVFTSRAILSNAAAVGIGFLVLLFSEYGVIANIGWITALSMFTTALGSLIILPALLAIFKPRVPGASPPNK